MGMVAVLQRRTQLGLTKEGPAIAGLLETIRRETLGRRSDANVVFYLLTPSTLRAGLPARSAFSFESTRLVNQNDKRRQRMDLNLHFDEVVVEVKRGGHAKQADISAHSKDCGVALEPKYCT
jgi:hypothetical protein